MKFQNRIETGTMLAKRLEQLKPKPDIVVALPRGGVPVGAQIATRLNLPLSVLVVRKIGAPFNPELAIGAVTADGTMVVDKMLVQSFSLNENELDAIIAPTIREAIRREHLYSSEKKSFSFVGRSIILVDDGIATGATMEAAILSLRQKKVKKIVIAVPVCPTDIQKKFATQVDKIFCLTTSSTFHSVGEFYKDFPQISDEEVLAILSETNI